MWLFKSKKEKELEKENLRCMIEALIKEHQYDFTRKAGIIKEDRCPSGNHLLFNIKEELDVINRKIDLLCRHLKISIEKHKEHYAIVKEEPGGIAIRMGGEVILCEVGHQSQPKAKEKK